MRLRFSMQGHEWICMARVLGGILTPNSNMTAVCCSGNSCLRGLLQAFVILQGVAQIVWSYECHFCFCVLGRHDSHCIWGPSVHQDEGILSPLYMLADTEVWPANMSCVTLIR